MTESDCIGALFPTGKNGPARAELFVEDRTYTNLNMHSKYVQYTELEIRVNQAGNRESRFHFVNQIFGFRELRFS